MPDGVAILISVEVRNHPTAIHLARVGEELIDCVGFGEMVVAGNGDFHTVACGKDQPLVESGPAFQLLERFSYGVLIERQPLAHLHRSALVVDASDGEFHLASSDRRPTWAAQVTAEQHSTAMAISAALRPRQPAVARKNTIVR